MKYNTEKRSIELNKDLLILLKSTILAMNHNSSEFGFEDLDKFDTKSVLCNIEFPPASSLKLNSIESKLLVASIRSKTMSQDYRNLFEIIFYNLTTDVMVDKPYLTELFKLDRSSVMNESLTAGDIFEPIDNSHVLTAILKYTDRVKKFLLDRNIELKHEQDVVTQFMNCDDNYTRRHAIVGYIIGGITDTIYVGPPTKLRQRNLKRLIGEINSHYTSNNYL